MAMNFHIRLSSDSWRCTQRASNTKPSAALKLSPLNVRMGKQRTPRVPATYVNENTRLVACCACTYAE